MQRLLADERLLMVFPQGEGHRQALQGALQPRPLRHGVHASRDEDEYADRALRLHGGAARRSPPSPTLARSAGSSASRTSRSPTPWGLAVPIPAKLEVYYSPPMTFEGTGTEEDEVVNANVQLVKDRDRVAHRRRTQASSLRSPRCPAPLGRAMKILVPGSRVASGRCSRRGSSSEVTRSSASTVAPSPTRSAPPASLSRIEMH